MIRALFRWVARAGVVAGIVALARRLLRQRHGEPEPVATPTRPTPAKPKSAAPPARPAKQAPKKAKAATKVAPKAATPKAAAPKAAAPKAAAPPKDETPRWVEPKGGVCPTTHQVKAKMSSRIFHLPGMQNYDRTVPDRCYTDAAAAEADGLRPAKR